MSINKVIISGRLTAAPKFATYGETGKKCTFTIAARATDEHTDFVDVCAFGIISEVIAKYVKKGDSITIEGHIHCSNYTKEDKIIYTTKIIAEKFEFGSQAKANRPEAVNDE